MAANVPRGQEVQAVAPAKLYRPGWLHMGDGYKQAKQSLTSNLPKIGPGLTQHACQQRSGVAIWRHACWHCNEMRACHVDLSRCLHQAHHFFGVVLPTVLVYWPAGTTLQLSPAGADWMLAGDSDCTALLACQRLRSGCTSSQVQSRQQQRRNC